ncbi:MAG: aminotransferase class I/II-fold pyridoxal phosphate-dependent enzyme, partial [bacterium]|nr:aminotransferase class I/II-fold pyridoxal phosphate-dependent enzyme [bacterium]
MHDLARSLNDTLESSAPVLLSMLSEKGKQAFFPWGGILGQTAEAKGKTYNATIGIALEDDRTPMRLPSLESQLQLPPQEVYPYASSFGVEALRKKWHAMIQMKNPGLRGPSSLPVVAAGLTHALSVVSDLFLDPEDELLLPDKFWGNYRLIFEQGSGAVLRTFPTFDGDAFHTDALREALTEGPARKRVLLLNFPNNPTGYSATKDEAIAIADA